MATGNSGSFKVSGTKNMSCTVYWSETYDVAANSHIVKITNLTFTSTNWYGFVYYLNGSVSINGSTVATFSSTLGSHSVRVDYQNVEAPIQNASGYRTQKMVPGVVERDGDNESPGASCVAGYSKHICHTG